MKIPVVYYSMCGPAETGLRPGPFLMANRNNLWHTR
jgi:hypothetical protein